MSNYPDNYCSSTAPDGHRTAREEAAEDRLQGNIETNLAVKSLIEKLCAAFAAETLQTLLRQHPDALHNGQYAKSELVKHCYSGWVTALVPASLEKAASYLAETLGDFVITLPEELEQDDEE